MNRYMAFYLPHYYPNGGSGDLIGQYETLDEAIAALQAHEEKDDATMRRFYPDRYWSSASGEVYDCVSERDVWNHKEGVLTK